MSNHFSELKDPSYVGSAMCPDSRMPHERLTRQVLLAKPMGKWPRGHLGTRWSDCISDLAWSHLGVEPAELPEIAVDNEIFHFLLGLLSLRPSLEEKQA